MDVLSDAVAPRLASPIAAARTLVLLPSNRMARRFGVVLHERAGAAALVPPRCLTPEQWENELALTAAEPGTLPDDALRPLILAPKLAEMDWGDTGARPGVSLASEFVQFFDEVRRRRLDGALLRSRDPAAALEGVPSAEAEVARAALDRARAVWQAYRDVVPRDRVDAVADLSEALAAGRVEAPLPTHVYLAGLGRVDAVRARVLRATLASADEATVFLPEPRASVDRLLRATWGPAEEATDPLAATRRLARALRIDAEASESVGSPSGGLPLRDRLQGVRDALDVPPAPPSIVVAGTVEDEAGLAAERVAGWLEAHGAPERGITVATADPDLAQRITERLRDAGLDADNTLGRPLAARPAGLLARFLLRAALTDLRPDPLLEVLAHPYVAVGGARDLSGRRGLRFERMARRYTTLQSGLAVWRERADDHDAAYRSLTGSDDEEGMKRFLDEILAAFAPLRALADGAAHRWAVLVRALRETWRGLAADVPLGTDRSRPDVTRLDERLTLLERDDGHLPAIALSGFARELGRLLADETVADHRGESIAVTVTGLVEARLARSDLLVLAGLNEGVFPGPSPAPAVLPGPARGRLGLDTWREKRAQESELFLRLLHGAPEVVLSCSRHRDGQPALPSSLLLRLQLALDLDIPEEEAAIELRTEPVPADALAAAQSAFAAEPVAVPRHAPGRPLTEWSWSGLASWRDCPYRALLERGFALKAEEDVRREFGAREYGSVVHEILDVSLAPDHAVHRALAAGDEGAAEMALAAVAAERFLPGGVEMPERQARLRTFEDLIPAFVACECERFAEWRPVAREQGFVVGLPDLHAWAEGRAAAFGLDPGPPLADAAGEVVLRGTIDRIDRARDGSGRLLVLDYKTGRVPPVKHVRELEDLQLLLYAAVVEMGGLKDVGGAVSGAAYYRMSPGEAPGPVTSRNRLPYADDDEDARTLLVEGVQALCGLAGSAADPGAEFPLLQRAVDGRSGALPCQWCDLRGVCRVEERELPAAVELALGAVVGRKEAS